MDVPRATPTHRIGCPFPELAGANGRRQYLHFRGNPPPEAPGPLQTMGIAKAKPRYLVSDVAAGGPRYSAGQWASGSPVTSNTDIGLPAAIGRTSERPTRSRATSTDSIRCGGISARSCGLKNAISSFCRTCPASRYFVATSQRQDAMWYERSRRRKYRRWGHPRMPKMAKKTSSTAVLITVNRRTRLSMSQIDGSIMVSSYAERRHNQ